MNNLIKEKLNTIKQINELALKGEIVIFGSTYMANFPFYELVNKAQLENAIYNRSLNGLTIEDAQKIVKEFVLDIKPSKIFIYLGEEDYTSIYAISNYNDIIKRIKQELPSTTLYLITLPEIDEKSKLFNQNIQNLCKNNKIIKINFNNNHLTKNREYKEKFNILLRFFRQRKITFSDAFKLKEL